MTHEAMRKRREEILVLWRTDVSAKELAYRYDMDVRSIKRIVANDFNGVNDAKTKRKRREEEKSFL